MNSKRILLAINILMVILVAWAAVDLVRIWTSGREPQDPLLDRDLKVEATGRKPLGETRRMSDYQAIAQQDIFRTTRQRPEKHAEHEKEEKIEVTRLNLKLKGVVVRKSGDSFAVITDPKTKRDEIYYQNDTLQNARIVKILPDHVVLEVGNRKEALLLFAESDQPGTAAAVKTAGRGEIRRPVKGAVGPAAASGRTPARKLPGT
ncbi:MAG: type II secretion system protein N [Desulfobacterales bacterium]|nr:type II secretion system protein N [Desulfobacterales bacterium]